ncbi:MAG: HAD family hydrolase [Chloroflexota bacterium]
MAPASDPASAQVMVFDLGGVLCQFQPERRLSALSHASSLSVEEVSGRLNESRLIERADRGELSRIAEFQEGAALLGLQCDYPAYRALWCSAFTPNPDVITIARDLRRQVRTVLLTNNALVLHDALAHELEIVGRELDDAFVSAMFGATKPDPAVFLGVEQALRSPSQNLTLIDDSSANVAGAIRAGWSGITFTSARRLLADLAILTRNAR